MIGMSASLWLIDKGWSDIGVLQLFLQHHINAAPDTLLQLTNHVIVIFILYHWGEVCIKGLLPDRLSNTRLQLERVYFKPTHDLY